MRSGVISLLLTIAMAWLVYTNHKQVSGLIAEFNDLRHTFYVHGNLQDNMITTSWESAQGTQTITTDVNDYPSYDDAEAEHDRRVAARQVEHPIIP